MTHKMVDYLIIGNSAAGVSAAGEIRRRDKEGSITIVGEESVFSYSRPLLSRYLSGEFSLERLVFRNEEFYRKNRIEVRPRCLVTGIRPEKKAVIVRAGCPSGEEQVTCRKLLLTAGSVPFRPDIPGLNSDGIFSFLSLDEVERVRDYLKKEPVKKVLVLGGGLIGLEAAEAFVHLGCQVEIVELAPYLLSTTFDRKASEIMANHLLQKGVTIHTEDTVTSFAGKKGRVQKAILKKGGEVSVDLAVVAVGVRPRTELAEKAGLAVGRGIVTDARMLTAHSAVFAAGDCAQAQNILSGVKQPLPLWPEAFRQGRVAGANMAAGDEDSKPEYGGGLVMNALEILGLPTISAGITEDPKSEVFSDYRPEEKIYRKILIKDNHVTGYIFIGQIERAGIYTGLIKERVNVAPFKDNLLDEDFGLIYLPSDYRKHLVKGEGIEV